MTMRWLPQWSKLTDDPLDFIAGQGDLLMDRAEEADGIARDQTQKQLANEPLERKPI